MSLLDLIGDLEREIALTVFHLKSITMTSRERAIEHNGLARKWNINGERPTYCLEVRIDALIAELRKLNDGN